MKLGIFTDSHYSSAEVTCKKRFNSASLEKIAAAYRYFEAEQCRLVVCLGDLIDRENDHEKEIENLTAISDVICRSGIRTVCVMGNHDAFAFSRDEFYQILGASCRPPHSITAEQGSTLLFLDACYFSNGTAYAPGDSDWKDTFFPYTDRLRAELEAACGDVYVFMHQNIDPTVPADHRLANDAEVRKVLERSGKVKAVFQGHYHKGSQYSQNGINFVTYPAMCEGELRHYIAEI